MVVFWIIGVLFLVVGLIFCVPRYIKFIKYKGHTIGKITKIETNGRRIRAIFEYCVCGNNYIQNTGWTSNGIFIIGEECNVIYNTNKPNFSYIKKSGQLIQCIVGTLFVIVGLVSVCLGILLNSIL
ncbi:hypothetical protein NDGK_02138 [Clostridiales bacterium CHKCI001]|nr:hypothetical protein NDGK_02138 [Clostridiales bacterium CHKCI001]